MPLVVKRKDWVDIFPKAPKEIIDAFVDKADLLDKVGMTKTRSRLAYALANAEHECGGFTLKNLTENINYTAERMAEIWPKRFASADAVRRRFGTAKGWQKKAFDDIYGNRMGNRPGTSDGSTYIGRGCAQVTGREGYEQVGDRSRLKLVDNPELASLPEHQPAILAAFWSWKKLNAFADAGDFEGCVKAWNGGLIGFADRKAKLKGNDPIIMRLMNLASIMPSLDRIS